MKGSYIKSGTKWVVKLKINNVEKQKVFKTREKGEAWVRNVLLERGARHV